MNPFLITHWRKCSRKTRAHPHKGSTQDALIPRDPPTGTGWKQRGKYPKFWLSLREVGSPCLSGNPAGLLTLLAVQIHNMDKAAREASGKALGHCWTHSQTAGH